MSYVTSWDVTFPVETCSETECSKFTKLLTTHIFRVALYIQQILIRLPSLVLLHYFHCFHPAKSSNFTYYFTMMTMTQRHYTCFSNHFQIFCCNYPHTDFAFVDFVMTPVILALLKIMIWFDLISQHLLYLPSHTKYLSDVRQRLAELCEPRVNRRSDESVELIDLRKY